MSVQRDRLHRFSLPVPRLLPRRPSLPRCRGNEAISARVEYDTKKKVASVTVPKAECDLPIFLLSLSDYKYLTVRERLIVDLCTGRAALINEPLEIYSFAAQRTDEFKARFAGAEPRSGYFEPHLLYRLLECATRYVPVTEYLNEYQTSQMEECLYLLRDAGVSKVIIDEQLFETMTSDTRRDLDLALPMQVPVLGNPSGNVSATSRGESTAQRNVKHERTFGARPVYQPHVKDDACTWYYRNKKMHETLQLIVQDVEEHGVKAAVADTEAVFHLLIDQDATRYFDLQGRVVHVVGVGRKVTQTQRVAFDLTIEVKFFSAEALEAAKEWVNTARMRGTRAVRHSLSGLASLRSEFADLRTYFREDVIVYNRHGAPFAVNELSLNVVDQDEVRAAEEVEARMRARLQGAGRSLTEEDDATLARAAVRVSEAKLPLNIFTVCYTLYGPRGGGRTSVIYTWRVALMMTARRYYIEGAQAWQHMDGPGKYTGFLKAVKFDPTLRSGRNADNVQKVDDDIYKDLGEKNLARVFLNDTEAAVDAHEDVDGDVFPFGIQILVLNYAKVEEMRENALGADASDDSKDRAATDLKATAKFLGHVNTRAPSTAAAVLARGATGPSFPPPRGKLSRYPPMVTLLARGPVQGEDADADVLCDEVTTWLSEKLDIKWVYAMPTFGPPAEVDSERYISMSNTREMDRAWEKKALQALRVLSQVIQRTVEHEQLTVKRFLLANPDRLAVVDE